MATKKQRLRRKADSGYDIIHLETSADLVEGLEAAADARVADKVFASGSATKGVYIGSNGKVTEMTYSVNKDVPADAKFTDTVSTPGSATPTMDGTATVGTSIKYAREDHVHPTDTSRASADVVTEHGERITTLESETKLLSELVEGVDTPIYRTASGNPATFADGYAANVKALSVEIAPTQSGSGDPYPPGGERNLIPMTLDLLKANNNSGTWNGNAYTRNGITFTANTDAGGNVVGVTLNGTISSGSTSLNLGSVDFMANTAYLVSGAVQNDVNARIAVFTKGSDTGSGYRYEPTEDDPGREISIYINTAGTISNVTFHPMIRRASDADPTFAPYSNIRPISGVSSVTVRRYGKNLFPQNTVSMPAHTGNVTVPFPEILPAGIYTLSANVSSTYQPTEDTSDGYLFIVTSEDGRELLRHWFAPGVRGNFTFNSGTKKIKSVLLYVGKDYTTSYPNNGEWTDIQFESGSVATDYQPHDVLTVQLVDSNSDPLTVYGGTLNVTTGELTVTYRKLTLVGSLISESMRYEAGFPGAWLNNLASGMHTYPAYNPNNVEWNTDFSLCDMIPVTSNPYGKAARGICIRNTESICLRLAASDIPDFSDTSDASAIVAAVKRFLDDKTPTLVYRLATPLTYQLTPEQLATFSGYNSVSTSNGTVSVTYRSDIGLAYDDLRKTFTNTILSLGAGI